jgi:hypothetical protein
MVLEKGSGLQGSDINCEIDGADIQWKLLAQEVTFSRKES